MSINPGFHNPTISVVILDDQDHQREGLKNLIATTNTEVTGIFGDRASCLEFVKKHQPDVAVIDLKLSHMGPVDEGLEVVQEIKSISPRTKCLVATTFGTVRRLMAAVQTGVEGFVWKESPSSWRPEWDKIVRIVASGGKYYDMELIEQLLPYIDQPRLPIEPGDIYDENDRVPNPLTEREQALLKAHEEGLNTDEIGIKLVISSSTVKSHFNNIFSKLKAHSRGEALSVARRHGFL